MNGQDAWSLISEVLQTGPADGREILEHAQSNDLWEALYLASRSSPYASTWRECFGRQRVPRSDIKSILELAAHELVNYKEKAAETTIVLAKLIANCCADNNYHRGVAIHAGVLAPLMRLLSDGADPNILVPTIYNVCADYEGPTECLPVENDGGQDEITVTLAEERLATVNDPSNSIFTGMATLLHYRVVTSCNDKVREYLADLILMAAMPAAVVRKGVIQAHDTQLGRTLARSLSADSGQLLAKHSVKCKASIGRALVAISTSNVVKEILATTGIIFDWATSIDIKDFPQEFYDDDLEEQQENQAIFKMLETAMLKLTYEVCQLPQFTETPKYGIARKSTNIVQNQEDKSVFCYAIAYIILYGFVDNDVRANLLVSEGLVHPLVRVLHEAKDKTILYPAVGLAAKLAVTWSLRTVLCQANIIQAVHHLLIEPNLGYEIPLNVVTLLELLIKGHPIHIEALLQRSSDTRSVLDDVFQLFDKGQDVICHEIGRLFIETCATLGQYDRSDPGSKHIKLSDFAQAVDPEALHRVLVYMATKATITDKASAERVWLALGILSTCEEGKHIVRLVLQNSEVQQQVQQLGRQSNTPSIKNLNFIAYNLGFEMKGAKVNDLEAALGQMELG